jgi:hypothetical protein
MVHAFLDGIALHVCDPSPATKEYFEWNATINACLTNVLWKVYHISQYENLDELNYGELEIQLNGVAIWYFKRKTAPGFIERLVVTP